jgi:hypothetical protein
VVVGDPASQQRLAGRGQPFNPIQRSPQLTGRRTGHRVRVQPIDQRAEPVAETNHHVEHAFESNQGDRHRR